MTNKLNVEVMIILTTRSPEEGPEVNLEADHLMGLAVLLPTVTEFILVKRLILLTGARIEITDQMMAHTIVLATTGTIPVMRDTVMMYYDFNCSRYYDWGYDRRCDDRGRCWSPCWSPPCYRPYDHHSNDLRDRHPWADPSFRDR